MEQQQQQLPVFREAAAAAQSSGEAASIQMLLPNGAATIDENGTNVKKWSDCMTVYYKDRLI